MLWNFCCQETSFFYKHNFFVDKKHMQWNLDTKVKVFHESILCFIKCIWNCISENPRNTLKENFAVYPCLNVKFVIGKCVVNGNGGHNILKFFDILPNFFQHKWNGVSLLLIKCIRFASRTFKPLKLHEIKA